jgi:type IV secretion system protein VirB3
MSSGAAGDVLYLACTRPAMKRGVPMEGYYLNFFGSFFFGLVMSNPFCWLVFFLLHPVMRALANKNPNFFREWRMWFSTKGTFAGPTLHALPSRNARKAEDMPSYV